MADVIEPALTTLDEPPGEDRGLPPSFEFDLSTLSEAEATAARYIEGMPTAAETPPEGLLTSSDMFALENLEDPMPQDHLTLELEPPALPTDLASSRLGDRSAYVTTRHP